MKTTFGSTLKGVSAACLLAASFTTVHAFEVEQLVLKPDAVYTFTYSQQSYQGSLDHELDIAQQNIMASVRADSLAHAKNELALSGERLANDARLADTAGGSTPNLAPWRASALRTFL
ncbi:hypothetical protein [Pseudidiomarina sp. YC-516-91]|uniref:hypothetical protein n=1 Tax=Pseudidiomarina salilacus TaxID=3384452 RepID=UPI003984ABE7